MQTLIHVAVFSELEVNLKGFYNLCRGSEVIIWPRSKEKTCISSESVKSLFPFSMLSSFLKFIRGQNPNFTLCRQYKVNTFPNFHHTPSSHYSSAAFPSGHSIPAHASPKTAPPAWNWQGMTAVMHVDGHWDQKVQSAPWHSKHCKRKVRKASSLDSLNRDTVKNVTSFWKPVQVMWTTPELSKQVTSAETRNLWQTLLPYHQFMLFK